jgi:hypothetical protein
MNGMENRTTDKIAPQTVKYWMEMAVEQKKSGPSCE